MKLPLHSVSFHMPGHKGRLLFDESEVLKHDITELPGTDNLLHPTGWLLELSRRISRFYGSRSSRMLTNGSTAGILASILSFRDKNTASMDLYKSCGLPGNKRSAERQEGCAEEKGCTEKVALKPLFLINSNSHVSVYNALEMGGFSYLTFDPEMQDGIPSHFDTAKLAEFFRRIRDFRTCDSRTRDSGSCEPRSCDSRFSDFRVSLPETLGSRIGSTGISNFDEPRGELCDEPRDVVLVLTYPFYHGGLYDIRTLIRLAKAFFPEITVIVDEAHGAHLVLEEALTGKPLSALNLGADIVIQSFHKTLPALGSSSVLHYARTPKGQELFQKENEKYSIEWFLKTLQTTSPSYLILESVAQMMTILETEGVSLYRRLLSHIDHLYRRIGGSPFYYKHSREVLPLTLDASFRTSSGAISRMTRDMDTPHGAPSNPPDGVPSNPPDSQGFDFQTAPTVQDRSKILLPHTDQDVLIRHGIYPEMQDAGHLLLLSSIANTADDFDRLADVLLLSGNLSGKPLTSLSVHTDELLQSVILRGDVTGCFTERPAREARGCRAAETVLLYPPGAPCIRRGEVFTEEICKILGDTVVKVL